jgi:hypothetical protein
MNGDMVQVIECLLCNNSKTLGSNHSPTEKKKKKSTLPFFQGIFLSPVLVTHYTTLRNWKRKTDTLGMRRVALRRLQAELGISQE